MEYKCGKHLMPVSGLYTYPHYPHTHKISNHIAGWHTSIITALESRSSIQSEEKSKKLSLSPHPKQEEKRTEARRRREVEKEGRGGGGNSPLMAYARILAKAGRLQGYIMRPISKSVRPDFISSTLNTKGGNNKNAENILDANQKGRIKYLFLSNKTGTRRRMPS